MTIEEIRKAISVLPRVSNGKLSRVPLTLRGEILSLAKNSSIDSAARAIGISPTTINHWRGPAPSSRKFRKIAVSPLPENVLTVEGPRGLRIRGSVKDIASLIREVNDEF